MGYPRVITGRSRVMRLYGSFSFGVAARVSVNSGIWSGSLRAYGAMKARLGNVRSQLSQPGTYEQGTYISTSLPSAATGFSGTDGYYSIIVQPVYRATSGGAIPGAKILIQGMPLLWVNVDLLPAIATPTDAHTWTLSGTYEIQVPLREVLELPNAAGRHRMIEEWDPDGSGFASVTVGGHTETVTYTEALPNSTDGLFDPYTPGIVVTNVSHSIFTLAPGLLTTSSATAAFDAGWGDELPPAASYSDSSGSATELSAAVAVAPSSAADTFNSFVGATLWRPAANLVVHGFQRGPGGEADLSTISEITANNGVSTSVLATKTEAGDWTHTLPFGPWVKQHVGNRGSSTARASSDNLSDPLPSSLQYVNVRYTDASKTAAGVPNANYFLHGLRWDALTLAQASTATLQDSGWIAGADAWSSSTATLSEVSGAIRIIVGGSVGGATRATGGALRYRFLRVRCRSVGSANQPLTLTLTGNSPAHTIATGDDGEWVERLIDLAYVPDTGSGEGADGVLTDAWTGIALSGLTAGATYEIAWIKGVRQFDTRWVGFQNEIQVTGTTWWEDLFIGGYSDLLTDGALVQTWGNSGYDLQAYCDNATNDSDPVTGLTAAPVLGPRVGKGDWASIYAASVPTNVPLADLADSEGLAIYLHGGGLLVTRDDAVDVIATEADALEIAGTTTLQSQMLTLQGVQVYPWAGDLFGYGDGAYGQDIHIAFSQRVKGGLHGLLITSGGANPGTALPATTVRMETEGGDDRGSGTTLPSGYFRTGAPFGAEGIAHVLAGSVEMISPPGSTYGVTNGRRTYVAFPVALDTWICVDASLASRLTRAYQRAGSLYLGSASATLPAAWEDADTGIAGSRPCVRYDARSGAQRVWLAYQGGGGIALRSTPDEGESWSIVTTVFTGEDYEFPTLTIPRSGVQYHYAVQAGAIKGRILDPFGGEIEAEFTAVASGVDADAISASWFVRSQGTLAIVLQYRSGGAIVVKTSTDGKTFV